MGTNKYIQQWIHNDDFKFENIFYAFDLEDNLAEERWNVNSIVRLVLCTNLNHRYTSLGDLTAHFTRNSGLRLYWMILPQRVYVHMYMRICECIYFVCKRNIAPLSTWFHLLDWFIARISMINWSKYWLNNGNTFV